MRFADADDEYEDSDFVVAGIPLDSTTTFRKGTKFGPNAVRQASHNFEPYVPEVDTDLNEVETHDHGDIDTWNQPREVVEFASGIVEDLTRDSKTPILIGGEHTISVAGFRGAKPDVFVSLDAHLDLKEKHEGREYNHASVSRLAFKEGLDVYVLGVRSGSREEYGFAETSDEIQYFKPDELRDKKIQKKPIEEIKTGYDRPYLSFDLDALDPGFAPGVGTPEPYGLRPEDTREIITSLAPHCVGFDAVEVCPSYDSGQAAVLAAKSIRDFIAWSASRD